MKYKKYIDHICEELDGACSYAYKYIEQKNEKPRWAGYYHTMSEQELDHAMMLMEIATDYIANLAWKSADMEDEWACLQRKYAEKTALVKLMLQA